MALARGICPVCGEERAVRGGSMYEHTDPRTKARNTWGIATSDPCQGIGQPPSRQTKTQEQVDEENAKKKTAKINKNSAPFKDLSDDVKEAFSKAVMEFDEPGICDEGRRRFLMLHGFPIPPRTVTVTLYVEVDAPNESINNYGEPTKNFAEQLVKKAKESLPEVKKISTRPY